VAPIVAATMLLAAIYFIGTIQQVMLLYPLAIGGVCIVTSIISTFFVRLDKSKNIMHALYKGLISSAILSASRYISLLANLSGSTTSMWHKALPSRDGHVLLLTGGLGRHRFAGGDY